MNLETELDDFNDVSRKAAFNHNPAAAFGSDPTGYFCSLC